MRRLCGDTISEVLIDYKSKLLTNINENNSSHVFYKVVQYMNKLDIKIPKTGLEFIKNK